MRKPPLQLEGCFFTRVDISSSPDVKNEDRPEIEVAVTTWPDRPESLNWFTILTVKLTPQKEAKATYVGTVEIFGSFSVDSAWPKEQIERLVYINGSGILYASAREMICQVTARGLYKMFMLPSWSFASMYEEKIKKDSKADALGEKKQESKISENQNPVSKK